MLLKMDNIHLKSNTGTSKIEVLGTKFNISAYPEEKYVEVVLEDGKVKFSRFRISFKN
jgi:hypothetical protein